MRTCFSLIFLSCMVGCASQALQSSPIVPLQVRSVEWNLNSIETGRVQAVTDDDDDSFVLSDRGAFLFQSGALMTHDASIQNWRHASTIPAADGQGLWLIAVAHDGQLYRLRARKTLEPVSARYGLAHESVREVHALGGRFVAFVLPASIAISDGQSVTHYKYGPFQFFSSGEGFGAGILDQESNRSIRMLHSSQKIHAMFSLPQAQSVAFYGQGQLLATTPKAFYVQNHNGPLLLKYKTLSMSLGSLTPSKDHIWFRDGARLALWNGTAIEQTQHEVVPEHAHLWGSTSGDVWVVSNGKLSRWQKARSNSDHELTWSTGIAPIFNRVCVDCHRANSGIALATEREWQQHRTALFTRVIQQRTMPPLNSKNTLTEKERTLIQRWLESMK